MPNIRFDYSRMTRKEDSKEHHVKKVDTRGAIRPPPLCTVVAPVG